MNERPKRHLQEKECDRCHEVKSAEEFPKVRGGGTADICKTCKRVAVSVAMKEIHANAARILAAEQKDHFKTHLEREQARWDSLPDGHPYKAPRRPGSESED